MLELDGSGEGPGPTGLGPLLLLVLPLGTCVPLPRATGALPRAGDSLLCVLSSVHLSSHGIDLPQHQAKPQERWGASPEGATPMVGRA